MMIPKKDINMRNDCQYANTSTVPFNISNENQKQTNKCLHMAYKPSVYVFDSIKNLYTARLASSARSIWFLI